MNIYINPTSKFSQCFLPTSKGGRASSMGDVGEVGFSVGTWATENWKPVLSKRETFVWKNHQFSGAKWQVWVSGRVMTRGVFQDSQTLPLVFGLLHVSTIQLEVSLERDVNGNVVCKRKEVFLCIVAALNCSIVSLMPVWKSSSDGDADPNGPRNWVTEKSVYFHTSSKTHPLGKGSEGSWLCFGFVKKNSTQNKTHLVEWISSSCSCPHPKGWKLDIYIYYFSLVPQTDYCIYDHLHIGI